MNRLFSFLPAWIGAGHPGRTAKREEIHSFCFPTGRPCAVVPPGGESNGAMHDFRQVIMPGEGVESLPEPV